MNNLVVITGPTSVGKTDLSIKLAKKINGEIISADSIQVYRHLNIGSAKITVSEMDGIPHHLIDVLNPDEEFSVHTFQSMAKECMKDIYSRNKIPMIVGGTGFYIQSVLYDIDFDDTDDNHPYRLELEKIAKEKGSFKLHNMLKAVDPDSAGNIHPNNIKRIIRALEYYHDTGRQLSIHNKEQRSNDSPYNFAYFVLNDERQLLYDRINKRVEKMITDGLETEVRSLIDMGYHSGNQSMQGIGYKEMLDYINGNISKEEAIALIQKNTRHFAKRQLTWFRREKTVDMIYYPDFDYNKDKILQYMLIILKNRNIIKDIE